MCNLPAVIASPVYQIAKDFAPTALTFIAAVVAVLVNIWFNRRQSATATRAADIAHDRLRFDLFDKRYEIYTAAKEAIEIALARSEEDKEPEELSVLFIKFNEAHFFFPEDVYVFLNQLRNDINIFLRRNYVHRMKEAQNEGTQDAQMRQSILQEGTNMLELKRELYEKLTGLPKTFAHALAFPRLTSAEVRALPLS